MAPVSPPGVAASRGSMFSSLQHRDFRLVWAGSLCASMAMNVQQAARGWLIFEMTHSAARLSWVVISFTLPQLLFALFGGALADRLPKKQLMIAAQSLNFVAACGMAYVIFSHEVTFWHFIALGIFNGTVLALSMPSRQSIIPELVGDTDLVNAIALNTASMNLSRILGPVVAGLTIAAFHIDGQIPYFGAGLSYVLIAALYFMGVMTLTRVTIAARPSRVGARPGMLKDIGAGIAYIRNSKIMLGLVATGTLPMMFGQPMQNLIPAFNTTVVHGGPLGNGLLLAATGSGAIFGTLLFAKYGDSGRKGRLLFAGLAMWGIGADAGPVHLDGPGERRLRGRGQSVVELQRDARRRQMCAKRGGGFERGDPRIRHPANPGPIVVMRWRSVDRPSMPSHRDSGGSVAIPDGW